jgi:hypothetical protein
MQELLLRNKHKKEIKDATKPDILNNNNDAINLTTKVIKPPLYNLETDLNFCASLFTIDLANLERLLPACLLPAKLEAPCIGVDGGSWILSAEH